MSDESTIEPEDQPAEGDEEKSDEPEQTPDEE